MMQKLFCWLLVAMWVPVSAVAQPQKGIEVIDESVERGPSSQKGRLDHYLSEEEKKVSSEEGEGSENELLAPVAKPVVSILEGVGSAVEPLLEEKEIKDEKGETKAKIKPKEGKFQVEF